MTTKIVCRARDCIFWENKLCTSEEIIYDPDDGCLTYENMMDINLDDDDDLLDDDDDDDELLDDDDDDELWDDDDDLFLVDDDLDDDKWQL